MSYKAKSERVHETDDGLHPFSSWKIFRNIKVRIFPIFDLVCIKPLKLTKKSKFAKLFEVD